MEDIKIISLFNERDERAIEITQNKYGRYCYSIAYSILERHEDAEECVNDTWVKTWNSIPPQAPSCLRAFLAKITRNIAYDRHKFNSRQKRGGREIDVALDDLAECLPSTYGFEEYVRVNELRAALNSFLRGISEKDRNIFILRFFFVYSTEKIASGLGMNHGTVMNSITKTKKKLKEYLKKEGFWNEK